MWWEAVFWILLLPLIVIEIIVFVKSKKVFWLIYALAIFTYVVAVCYTLDVFAAGRNAIILTLLASSGLMVLIGRHLGRSVKRQKRVTKATKATMIALGAILIILFTVSVIMGRAQETLRPVESVSRDAVVTTVVDPNKIMEPSREGVVLLTRTVANPFFLPVPLHQDQYTACLVTSEGSYDLYSTLSYEQNPEVGQFSTKEFPVRFMPASFSKEQAAGLRVTEVRIYANGDKYTYVGCAAPDRDPAFIIPVTG